MRQSSLSIIIFILIVIILSYSNLMLGQQVLGFQYLNPLPNSSYVSVQSTIIIRQGGIINKASINVNIIRVSGSKSGNILGKLVLSDDQRTLIFTPNTSFQTDEIITVTLQNGLTTNTGVQIGGLTFSFHTAKSSSILNTANQNNNFAKSSIVSHTSSTAYDSTLPSDFPPLIINQSNNPSPGYLFLSPSPYLAIVDNKGTPVFYRNVQGDIYDFDLQPDGELTYFIYPVDCYGLDSSLNMERVFITTGGFSPDVHELHVLPNGNYYIFGKRLVQVDMSKIVSGGQSNAELIDGALQEFDASGNLIFQWDAIDHYKITDVDSYVDLTQPTIDFSHFNSVAWDSDGDLLISARNLDEITKVDPNTGNIIWRLGGKNNQFTFINDNLGFSRQHDIRRFSNGDISIFDNGDFHPVPTPYSSGVEYKLDEVNKTATLVRRISYEGLYTDTEGSVEELSNGNRFMSWGHNYAPVVTEFTPDDSVAFELSYTSYYDTYRAFRYNWETNLFKTNTDTLDFGQVPYGNSKLKSITVYNPHDTAVTINYFYCDDSSFTSSASLPITLSPFDSIQIPILFKPSQNGVFQTSFNLRDISYSQGSQQMIARQVIVKGTTGDVSSANVNINLPKQFQLYQNYPNPFNPTTQISYTIPTSGVVTIKVYDVLGNEITTLVNKEENPGNYNVEFDGSKLSSGIYFYRMQINNFVDIKKLVLMK
ncbi:MAG: arylsulfotransferase family protein [Ignavibacteriaceae bacterium]